MRVALAASSHGSAPRRGCAAVPAALGYFCRIRVLADIKINGAYIIMYVWIVCTAMQAGVICQVTNLCMRMLSCCMDLNSNNNTA